MLVHRLVTGVLVLILGFAAQVDLGRAEEAKRLLEVPSHLRVGQRVRIEVSEFERLEGPFLAFRADTLFISHPTRGAIGIGASDIDSIWTRGRSGKTGVVIGAAVGALAAGVLLYMLRDLDLNDEPGTAGFGVGTVIGAELIGIGTGGLIGLGIGSLIPKWHRRYP